MLSTTTGAVTSSTTSSSDKEMFTSDLRISGEKWSEYAADYSRMLREKQAGIFRKVAISKSNAIRIAKLQAQFEEDQRYERIIIIENEMLSCSKWAQ